jgi:hypothetical protein
MCGIGEKRTKITTRRTISAKPVRCASESVTEQQFCGVLLVISQLFGELCGVVAATHGHVAAEDHAELAVLEHAPEP